MGAAGGVLPAQMVDCWAGVDCLLFADEGGGGLLGLGDCFLSGDCFCLPLADVFLLCL